MELLGELLGAELVLFVDGEEEELPEAEVFEASALDGGGEFSEEELLLLEGEGAAEEGGGEEGGGEEEEEDATADELEPGIEMNKGESSRLSSSSAKTHPIHAKNSSTSNAQRPFLERFIRSGRVGSFAPIDQRSFYAPRIRTRDKSALQGPTFSAMSQRRRVCAVCGSTRFRLLSSQLVCYAGHIQRDFRVESAHDDEGFDTQVTTRTRSQNRSSQRDAARLEKQRRLMEERRKWFGRTGHVFPGSAEHAALEDPDSALLTGARATFAVLQCFQLVLRRQLEALQNWIPSECIMYLEVRAFYLPRPLLGTFGFCTSHAATSKQRR